MNDLIGGMDLNMSLQQFNIFARWDDIAGVWAATSKDVPGLALAAPTIEELKKDLKICVPELLELNGIVSTTQPDIPFRISMRGNIQEMTRVLDV